MLWQWNCTDGDTGTDRTTDWMLCEETWIIWIKSTWLHRPQTPEETEETVRGKSRDGQIKRQRRDFWPTIHTKLPLKLGVTLEVPRGSALIHEKGLQFLHAELHPCLDGSGRINTTCQLDQRNGKWHGRGAESGTGAVWNKSTEKLGFFTPLWHH